MDQADARSATLTHDGGERLTTALHQRSVLPMPLVPYDDRDGWIWMDGAFVPWREAKVHVLTHGLHYASAVFEGERMYGGEIFKLTEHTERLFKSAEILDFSIPYTVAEIDEACRATCARNGLSDCYVRPSAWRGAEPIG